MTRKDWDQMEKDYVEGIKQSDGSIYHPSYDELASKYGIRASYLRTRAAKEKWRDKKGVFQAEVERRSREEMLRRRVRDINKVNTTCLDLAKEGLYHLGRHLKDRIDAAKQLGLTEPQPMPLKEVESLGRSLERLQKAACVAMGIPYQQVALSSGDTSVMSLQLSETEAKSKLQDIEDRVKALQDDLDS